MGCCILLSIDLIILHWYLVGQNDESNMLAATGVAEADPTNAVYGFEDSIDKVNLHFCCMYYVILK